MRRTGLHSFAIALLAGMSIVTHGNAQTRGGSFETGLEAGPLLFFAGDHDILGGFLLSVEPHVDYFLSEDLALGVTGFFYHPVDGGLSQPALSFGGAFGHVKYHLNAGYSLSPYICGRIGMLKSNPDEVLPAGGVQIGLLLFVSRQVSINGTFNFGASHSDRGVALLTSLNLGASVHFP